jgi:hypothetical protein
VIIGIISKFAFNYEAPIFMVSGFEDRREDTKDNRAETISNKLRIAELCKSQGTIMIAYCPTNEASSISPNQI